MKTIVALVVRTALIAVLASLTQGQTFNVVYAFQGPPTGSNPFAGLVRDGKVALAKSYKDATWELDFLHERRPAQQEPSADEADRELFEAVMEMKDPTAPMKVRRHYTETIKALNNPAAGVNR
jgi:hypothetical protein